MSVNPKQKKLGPKQPLSDFERGQIVAYRDCSLSLSEICKRVHRNYYVVSAAVKEKSEQSTQQQEPVIKKEKRKSHKFSDRLSTIIKLSLTRHPEQPLAYHHEQIRMEGFYVSLSTLEVFVKELGFGRSSSSILPA
jgi:hypothetical protein